MKSDFIIVSLIVLLGFSWESAKGDIRSPEERHYRQLVFRSWRDSVKLLKTSVDPERQMLEIDLAASAFDYFYLLKNNEIEKNPIIEKCIEDLFKSGELRQSIVADPLNRSGISGTGNPRGTSSNRIIADQEYKNLKAEFLEFVKSDVSTDADENQDAAPKWEGLPVGKKPRELSKKFTKAITFKFIDENGKPIHGEFTLHQYKNGKYYENWHRKLPLNENGEIAIKEFPPEFEFGGRSKDDFYHYWVRSADLDSTKETLVHRCAPSGAMKFQIASFPTKYYGSLVVECHKKIENGNYKVVKGIGIFPNDPEHVIGGLDPGEYFIAIKFHYKDAKPIFKSTPFKIVLKKYTSLPKIEITEPAIEDSKH